MQSDMKISMFKLYETTAVLYTYMHMKRWNTGYNGMTAFLVIFGLKFNETWNEYIQVLHVLFYNKNATGKKMYAFFIVYLMILLETNVEMVFSE
jgi:hypothetical protein